jgi:Serine dehydrogenase proteinase
VHCANLSQSLEVGIQLASLGEPMSDPVVQFEKTLLSLEKQRKSRIYAIVHTAEPQHLCTPEFWGALRRREQFSGAQTLEILIHSPGGHANVAYRLAKYFRSHCKRLNILVPMQAKSAATLLCLNADTVFMGEFAELGPLDAQIKDELEKGSDFFSPLDEFKSMEFMKEYATGILDYFSATLAERGMSVKQALHEAIAGTVGIMNPLYSHIDPSRVGSYRRALSEGEEYAKRLLGSVQHPSAEELAEHLVWDYPAHDFVIDFEEAKAIGLPVQKLPISQEKVLINSLIGMMKNGIPYIGFAQPNVRRKPVAAKNTRKKVPVSIASAGTGNGSAKRA